MAGGNADAFQKPGEGKGDLIDLSRIDANTSRSGNQAFTLSDTKEKGTIWLRDKGGNTLVQGNVDGKDGADFRISIVDGDVRAADYSVEDFML